ncbi:hypothetical protein Sipo8835_37690 [Streptomyces ipomoeae]|uniref:Uncharacterized protein n=2 Tax=Streptomyces ipomoeae TaxID=103232 RepID=L1L5H9_9ACTN|nr:hypothetical protein [Streptomyces ipomoeae]EKX68049.1 hypothetical protein STRIP9103_03179 [Streptomyces ipomoeae 91-03]MDX2696224.1 hypothetical protein [Streptomyces ipomoeae]MDX2820839.1 hypothetical protein [Streptomyces ipomoeae]MDX2839361.1 hypothetical protein [Streptomyces ipomoeae]MDX2873278.1 hypothetical protein [Streptomyces ipomoeae]
MTVLHLADEGEAADLAAFLSRLLHYDRGAAVRLQAAGTALAVFGRPPSFEVLAIRAVRLAKPYENGLDVTLDVTVSAGELLESIDESAATAVTPAAVTGPPWAGVLPPRGGWRPEPGLPAPDALRAMVAAAVAEFRSRTQELPPEKRTRAELDRIGREIWSRPIGDTALPVRAAHAAQSLGFLRASGGGQAEGTLGLFSSGAWLRLRTAYGSIAVRRAGIGALGISVR